KEKITDNKFLGYSINATNIESLLVGGGRAKLNAEVMMGIELLVPSYPEQCKISEVLFDLDNLITLHQRKCDMMKEVKNYMLQNMFPKKG
ncbi:MAG: restriction endonuclease subunit S, partial [Eubacterium sp.]|nr:restriction endonuclease subunit S [Eubacterium sp.]